MRTLILYDSLHGNTKKIAESISNGFPSKDTVEVVSTEIVTFEKLKNIDLLIVGSPTHGGTAKPTLLTFLKDIPNQYLKDIKIAAFDTRFLESKLGFALKLLVRTIGYAAPKISKILISKGGVQIVEPEGFIVNDTEGPIAEGEEKRAQEWGKKIYSLLS